MESIWERYLGEFVYRFNRRFELDELIDRLTYVSYHIVLLPYRLLK